MVIGLISAPNCTPYKRLNQADEDISWKSESGNVIETQHANLQSLPPTVMAQEKIITATN